MRHSIGKLHDQRRIDWRRGPDRGDIRHARARHRRQPVWLSHGWRNTERPGVSGIVAALDAVLPDEESLLARAGDASWRAPDDSRRHQLRRYEDLILAGPAVSMTHAL